MCVLALVFCSVELIVLDTNEFRYGGGPAVAADARVICGLSAVQLGSLFVGVTVLLLVIHHCCALLPGETINKIDMATKNSASNLTRASLRPSFAKDDFGFYVRVTCGKISGQLYPDKMSKKSPGICIFVSGQW